jgi:hypothetical protein
MFELSHQVATGKAQARQLFINLKTLQQRLGDTDIDATILQDLNICVAKAQEISTVSFLFIEKEAEKYIYPIVSRHDLKLICFHLSARKTTNYITNHTISETLTHLSQISTAKNSLATLILHTYFSSSHSLTNIQKLQSKFKAAEQINNLGDFPWTSNFEEVLETYKAKVQKLAVEIMVEECKGMIEGELKACFGRIEG